MKKYPYLLFGYAMTFLIVLSLWSACGSSSSGSGDVSDPADAVIDVSPDTLDSGDRTTVRIALTNWTDPEITVKVRVPAALAYVGGSSLFSLRELVYDVGPAFNESDASYLYLVYFLDRFELGAAEWGILSLELLGTSNATGQIGVDVDYHDRNQDDDEQFSVSSPQFDAQAEVYVRVGPAGTSSSSSTSTSSSSSSSSASSSSSSSSSSSTSSGN